MFDQYARLSFVGHLVSQLFDVRGNSSAAPSVTIYFKAVLPAVVRSNRPTPTVIYASPFSPSIRPMHP